MRITVVRHGETNYNRDGLHNADPAVDVHLTAQGIFEAQRVAEQLKEQAFDAIYISELPRTRATAEIINRYHHLPFIVDARLNDINSGFEGRSVDEYHQARDSAPDPFTYRKDNRSESPADVYRRTQEFLEFLKQTGSHDILIVTSMHNLRHFRNIIDQLDPRATLQQHIKNGSILERELE